MSGREAHTLDGQTRRGLLAGAATAGAAGALALRFPRSAAGAGTRPCAPTPPGVPAGALAVAPGGRTVWIADVRGSTITACRVSDPVRGRSIDVGGAPVAIAIAPDGATALVATAAWNAPGVAIVDLRTGHVERLEAGPAPRAVAFAPDGRTAYVAGGGAQGTLIRVDPHARRAHDPVALGADPHALAVTPDGRRALVTLNGESALGVVRLDARHPVRRIATPAFPHELALAPDGRHALVTHNGFGDRRVTPVDLHARNAGRQIGAGADPAGIAFSRGGTQAVVAARGSRRVAVIDVRRGRRRQLVKAGPAPHAVGVAGSRAVYADALTGEVRTFRLGALA